MVSEQEIARGVVELLCVPQNGGVSSLNAVVQQLSNKLGLDLSHKSSFIAHQINLLFQNDPFALHNTNPLFLHQLHYQHQLHALPSPFTLHFRGSQTHVPPSQSHVSLPRVINNIMPSKHSSKESNVDALNICSSQTGTKRRGGSGGLNKLCGVSPELQAIVGEATMSRTEIVRHLWAYIRKNNLQDPSNKRKIVCDEALRAVLETDMTDMFKMNKLLSKHILSLSPTKDPVPPKRQKLDVETGPLLADDVVAAEAAKSAKTSVGEATVVISDALASFLGTKKREMFASEAIQRVSEYVKVNGLENPSSLIVFCDEKLRELLSCESISMLEMSKVLARHHLLQSS